VLLHFSQPTKPGLGEWRILQRFFFFSLSLTFSFLRIDTFSLHHEIKKKKKIASPRCSIVLAIAIVLYWPSLQSSWAL
jgi:hypothetical protein